MATRLQFVSLSGEAATTTDTRLAAALYALDVPFDGEKMADTFAGDGIKGKFCSWYFKTHNPKGESSAAMLKAWDDRDYAASNPLCPLVNIKAAFIRHAELVRQIQEGVLECKVAPSPFLETPDTKMAAAMERLGHPIQGIAYRDGQYRFRFSQAAGADFALWTLPPKELERRLPDALISYLWCAFDNHRQFIDLVKKPKASFAVVEHKGRRAVVGENISQSHSDFIEKNLYRK